MSTRSQFKTIQDPGSVRSYAFSDEEKWEEAVWNEKRVKCSISIGKEYVMIKTDNLADYYMAKSVLRGRTSLEIKSDLPTATGGQP